MRFRVGYSPWPDWECWLVMSGPWWVWLAVRWLDTWAARFESWPAAHDLIWRPRVALMAYRQRRWPVIWWEYRRG